jgi:GTP pyrophosphokinase
LDTFLKNLKNIKTIDSALYELKSKINFTQSVENAVLFCIKAHKNQFRKSGEPYVIHPILTASITAYFSNNETMVIATLLHDVVEDTQYKLDDIREIFNNDVAYMVDGLTKIVEIRDNQFSNKTNKKQLASALSFRKMLIASIDDVRILVIKLCDRVHNMLTLNALHHSKQLRIAEETLVVYAPIAHRLGISLIKNTLEDLAFFCLYPDEYKQIDRYIQSYQQKIQLNFNHFVSQVENILQTMGYISGTVKITSRIKHYYSIYLKMQRKGINIDEVLDLQAIRIFVDDEFDCYKVLGVMHIEYKPLIARFKDYIAIPKENGYKTIHTTVFHDSKIYEVQIRTFKMHDIAEYGVAAHWKYKDGEDTLNNTINLNWLHVLELNNSDVEEFYNDTKQDLYSEDIVVYSPKGDTYSLPRGATVFDFAYEVHTDVGNKTLDATINKIKKPLLTQLKSGDIVSVNTGLNNILRCSWQDIVLTSKAKKSIKYLCSQRLKDIDELAGKSIINTIFSRLDDNITEGMDLNCFQKVPHLLDYLKNIKKTVEKKIRKRSLIDRVKAQSLNFKNYTIDNIEINSNFSINSVLFNHCCHPKFGDEIIAFKDDKTAIIHHKLCDNGYEKIKQNEQMLFCEWIKDKFYTYKMVVSLPNTRGELARLLTYLASHEATILFIEYGKDKYAHIQYCAIDFEINNSIQNDVERIVKQKAKVIEFYSAKDAYK